LLERNEAHDIKLLVFPVRRSAGLGFQGVGIHVFGQFCIGDAGRKSSQV
jgi:hypothetical protein